MKLSSAQGDQVVRNTNNGSHYRFDRMERGRAKIWPLELFPNGLLIPKSAPTTVSGDIDVMVVGLWVDGMVVEGKPNHSRSTYEKELVEVEAELISLEEQYALLPRSGTGHSSRGSHANKLKAARTRIDMLRRGLGFVEHAVVVMTTETIKPDFEERQAVQLPSGLPAIILSFKPVGEEIYARVRTKLRGAPVDLPVPCEVLRPWDKAQVCTL